MPSSFLAAVAYFDDCPRNSSDVLCGVGGASVREILWVCRRCVVLGYKRYCSPNSCDPAAPGPHTVTTYPVTSVEPVVNKLWILLRDQGVGGSNPLLPINLVGPLKDQVEALPAVRIRLAPSVAQFKTTDFSSSDSAKSGPPGRILNALIRRQSLGDCPWRRAPQATSSNRLQRE